MKITKFGHCCLLIEYQGVVVLTDPGNFSDLGAVAKLTGIDAFLITHEHQDHLHVETLKELLAGNPGAQVITNTAVGNILKVEDIKYQVIDDGKVTSVRDVEVAGFGTKHAPIYEGLPQVENTGYLIGGKLFYPGDAFTEPGKPVETLALPISGPWMKFSEAIDYARKIKPGHAFGVHDGILVQPNFMDGMATTILQKYGISYTKLEHGKGQEF